MNWIGAIDPAAQSYRSQSLAMNIFQLLNQPFAQCNEVNGFRKSGGIGEPD